MDGLGLIYIRKVFSLFIYVTLERRYCDVKSESEIFDLRNVVIVIIIIFIIVAWPVMGKYKMTLMRFWYKMTLINHVEWTKTCALCKGEFPLRNHEACVKCVQNIFCKCPWKQWKKWWMIKPMTYRVAHFNLTIQITHWEWPKSKKVSYFWGEIEWWPWSWPWSRFSRLFQGLLYFFKQEPLFLTLDSDSAWNSAFNHMNFNRGQMSFQGHFKRLFYWLLLRNSNNCRNSTNSQKFSYSQRYPETTWTW